MCRTILVSPKQSVLRISTRFTVLTVLTITQRNIIETRLCTVASSDLELLSGSDAQSNDSAMWMLVC